MRHPIFRLVLILIVGAFALFGFQTYVRRHNVSLVRSCIPRPTPPVLADPAPNMLSPSPVPAHNVVSDNQLGLIYCDDLFISFHQGTTRKSIDTIAAAVGGILIGHQQSSPEYNVPELWQVYFPNTRGAEDIRQAVLAMRQHHEVQLVQADHPLHH